MDPTSKSAAEQIDDIISKTDDWRSRTLSDLRAIITPANTGIVEAVKWKKPSRPEGIPVWIYGGKNICMADTLKNAVRLTFPNGAQLQDPSGLFNTRLDSKSVRAIDFYENTPIDGAVLQLLILGAIKLS